MMDGVGETLESLGLMLSCEDRNARPRCSCDGSRHCIARVSQSYSLHHRRDYVARFTLLFTYKHMSSRVLISTVALFFSHQVFRPRTPPA
jgi:hypothetical protein